VSIAADFHQLYLGRNWLDAHCRATPELFATASPAAVSSTAVTQTKFDCDTIHHVSSTDEREARCLKVAWQEAKMSGPLIINQGSPNWWLSPDIWVALPGAPSTPVANPIAGTTYEVYIRVYNNYPLAVTDWNLFVCWAIPTVGPIPLPPAAQLLNGAPFGSPINVPAGYPGFFQIFKTSTNWTPSFENGGHECLVAETYFQDVGFPSTGLNGDAPPTGDYSIAQHNLGVLNMGLGSPRRPPRFHYAFQAANGSDKEQGFVIEARLGPLSDIAAFLPCEAHWRKVLERPGKVEHLGIVASAEPHPAELENSTFRSEVKIAPRSCHPHTLTGSLKSGNALIHVTQRVGDRVVGGLSVLVTADRE
jgi:hypothetical protein